MAAKADFENLRAELRRALAHGSLGAADVRERLGISAATLSRLVERVGGELVVTGKARATRYLARRGVDDLPSEVPVFEVGTDGTTRELGLLTPVMPKGFLFSASAGDIKTREYPDLPYFLNDLRPSGYLGRAIPRLHPELSLPADIRTWSAETCLRYLSAHGWNCGGSLIVGEASLRQYLQSSRTPPLAHSFADLARMVMEGGQPGSSTGGEQPKFLTLQVPDGPHRIVKFSYPSVTPANRRVADLLVCEHLALEHIRRAGQEAASSEIVAEGTQTFLIVDRFDRVGRLGRRGLFSLLALHAEFSGAQGGWTEATIDLAKKGVVPAESVAKVSWLEQFGHMIANTDMHFGNLSFLAAGATVTQLAPAYDMSPALYAPMSGEIVERTFAPQVPFMRHAVSWKGPWEAALAFWRAAAGDPRISTEFRALCAESAHRLLELADVLRLMPQN